MKTLLVLLGAFQAVVCAQQASYAPVTREVLRDPPPEDWLMFNRTYDAQRFSPLKLINKTNVGQLRMVWSRSQRQGTQEGIPLVHDGIMYVITPGAAIEALDATTGDLKWSYQRDVPETDKGFARSKTIALWEDMVYTTAPDALVALDARTGEVRWEAKTDKRGQTSGTIIAGNKVISGGKCDGNHQSCYISAHDAKTGRLLWKFMTAAETGTPGGDSWGQTPNNNREAGTWGLPGTYDPATNLVIWGVANPTPNQRAERHAGDPFGIPTAAPADLFSNCTIALNADTGALVWYYQHLPGDDWDLDFTNDRTLVSTAVNPSAATAKWRNTNLKPGEKRDIVVAVGEPGGVFAIDRHTGEFLWANPWPYDVPNFFLSRIDPDGRTHLNEGLLFTGPNQHHQICFFNTRSYWSVAYSPRTNALYAPFVDACLDMRTGATNSRARRRGVVRDPAKPQELSGISKITLSTGKVEHIFKGPAPINGSMLTTAGDLVLFGDLDRKVRAIDADTGAVLWTQRVGGSVSNGMITYAVNGRQYIAITTGDGILTRNVLGYAPGLNPPRGANAIYVFALPDQ
jgi:alcohol dehydrogenase (cytochrome c)